MTRTDIHRPSSPDFDPEAYTCAGVFDLTPEWGNDGRMDAVNRAIADGYRFAAHANHGVCGHCGAALRYVALMLHADSHDMIYVGEDCLANRFEDMTAGEFARLRKSASLNRERRALADRVAAFYAGSHPMVVELSYVGNGGTVDCNSFLDDVAYKLRRYGDLSERQHDAVVKAIIRDADRRAEIEAREAAERARQADATPAPSGRLVVTGTVVRTWTKEGDYGTAHKFRVEDDHGFVVISTIPAKLIDALGDELGPNVNAWAATGELIGRRVRFTATLTPTEDDPTAAWANRPSKPELIIPVSA
jgi:hypothetical protein